MDTKPLERFATWARRELINAVDAQATAVLAVGSVARSERAEVIKKLEAEIASHGRQQVVDKVAYTWFNRIIALRFMDARGYTDAAVVSPAQGQAHGQPEILADAKRGNLDADVVTNSRTANAIIGLLDGTRRSTDAEGEAYALLLTEYCRYWHKPMPFMFEREGDYTELLVPANLLADGAILARAREVLTEGVCDDVEVIGWLYQFYISERKDEVFAGFRAKGSGNKKAGAAEIPAATQLFTPHWIVRYLVENSLGRLWLLNRPTSRLVEQMEYYIKPVDEETDFLRVAGPEGLKVIDPAVGSGHMLTYAFDLLYAIYEEEGYAPAEIPGLILQHNLYGTEIDPRAGALAAFALAMKARKKQRTFFSTGIQPNICVLEPTHFDPAELDYLWSLAKGTNIDRVDGDAFWNTFEHADTFGSLIQPNEALIEPLKRSLSAGSVTKRLDLFSEATYAKAYRVTEQAGYLSQQYSVLIANPPYMGSGNMGGVLAEFSARMYPTASLDLFATFMQRAGSLVIRGGYKALVTMESWMFLTGYADFRRELLRSGPILSLMHMPYLGKGGTSMGISFGTSATVLHTLPGDPTADFQCLRYYEMTTDGRPQEFPVNNERRSTRRNSSFAAIPGGAVAYWLTPEELHAFDRDAPLSAVVSLREGINTGDNNRFLRRWWEVSASRSSVGSLRQDTSTAKWVPIKKGGPFRRWAGNQEYVVNWENDGRAIRNFRDDHGELRSRPQNTQYFFRESASWGRISSGEFSMRYYGEGFAFDSTGPSAFGSERDVLFALGFLNSNLAKRFLSALSPTLDYRLGNLGSLPAPVSRDAVDLKPVRELIQISQGDWDEAELSWTFGSSPLIAVQEPKVGAAWSNLRTIWAGRSERTKRLEEVNNRAMATAYDLHHVDSSAELGRIALGANPEHLFAHLATVEDRERALQRVAFEDLLSFAVGCMFGRYSLNEPGLILANQGDTLQAYLAKVPSPSFMPDKDNVIPIVDGDWFEDDIVERFREFLRAAFGTEHFEENYRFVEESLGVKTLRDYFITKSGISKFYADHVQRYKKRPIYWMFSSPKGSFNALIYMHRYTPSTVSTVLNEYLREYRAKLEVALANAEQAAAGGGSAKEQKEADRLRKVLVELAEYEHDVLYPLATQQIVIDLDDGVKANYPKFYPALKNIAGLEVTE